MAVMSDRYLYFVLYPESLVASQLNPTDFGTYLALGSSYRSHSQAVFFELDPDLKSDYFPMDLIPERLKAHPNGKPKHSLYLSIYRVLEHIPISALKTLYLTTDNGKILPIHPQKSAPEVSDEIYFYQELCPVIPSVVSRYGPKAFSDFLTAPDQPVRIPRLVFCDQTLGELAKDPTHGDATVLPYQNAWHLSEGIKELLLKEGKKNKMIHRQLSQESLFRLVARGFYVGDQDDFVFYPMPGKDELEEKYYDWWKSALATRLG